MRKIITLDAVIVSLIGTMGYAFGYQVPNAYGFHPLICVAVCMIVGTVVTVVADKIIFSSCVQKDNKRRYLAFAIAGLLFVLGFWYLAHRFSYLLWNDVGQKLQSSVLLPLIAFVVSMVVQVFKRKKLLKKYGMGESGFMFDEDKTAHWLAEESGNNKEVTVCPEEEPVVKTFSAYYIGRKDISGVRFLGIPYAKAPVGANRWKKPIPLEFSDRIYEAYYFGNSEIQPESSHNILSRFKQDEDCLNLNIWMSGFEPEEKKPVFVYFHGGDGRCGGSTSPQYSLQNIAKGIPDAIFVSCNYRIGLFGVVSFDSSACPDRSEYENSTALSLLDQIEALKWIKSNISAFGGDPENITVAGNDAGGSCICLLSAVKEAKGLFSRALILCASTTDTPADDAKAAIVGQKLLEEFRAEKVSDLKTVSSEKLREFAEKNYDLLELPPRDGKFVPRDMEQLYLAGAASDIEFIFGIAADNASGWQAMVTGDFSIEEIVNSYYELFRNEIGIEKSDKAEALLQNYIDSGMSVTDAKRNLLADLYYKAAVLHDCKTLTRGGSKVRCFYWDVEGDIEKLTANSASIVTTILGNSDIAEQMGYLNDRNITEIMQALVSKFIHGQSPELFKNELKGFPEIEWKEYNADNGCVLHIKKNSICMDEKVFSENVSELEKLACLPSGI